MASLSRFDGPVLLIFAMFLLAGCDKSPKAWSQNDIEAIAADAAEDHAGPLESRIQTLESDVSQLESENSSLRLELSAHSH